MTMEVDGPTVDGFVTPTIKSIIEITDAKEFYRLTLKAERNNAFGDLPKLLNARLRLAILRNQIKVQSALINCILRVYFLQRNFIAASKFVEKINFPEAAHNNDLARFNYYQGRLKALQLDYESASQFFQQSIRKAPQDSAVAFKQNVQKWVVVVSLLQGMIPEREIFRLPIYRTALAAYLKLAQAVRLGNIQAFNEVLEQHSELFKKDETLTLIVRLRQNVIKTAIRQISLTYSRISIIEIAQKLQLNTEMEAEYVVEKAIKEQTIRGLIDYDPKNKTRFLCSNETMDIYHTIEPQLAFDSRIKSCLELHKLAVRALRYPSDSDKSDADSHEKQKEREILEMEFASEMADEDEDF